MYQYFNTIQYKNETIQDISHRFLLSITKLTNSNVPIFQKYTIKEWESPENIAFKLYGSCDYVWAILLANNIIDPFKDWLLEDNELKNYINKKYGESAKNVKYYLLNGIMYSEPVLNAIPVTFEEYEYTKNEEKRIIQVIFPNMIYQVEDSMRNYAKLNEE